MLAPDHRQPTSDTPAEASASLIGVSIIIPVHNKSTITRQCVDALLAEQTDGLDREIIVVDDGSSDATPAALAAYGNAIRVLRNDTALGFAGACNAGVLAARHDLFVLLNNDTIPTAGWLHSLVAHAVSHPEAAVVGVKLLFPNDTIQHAGVVFGLDSKPHHIYAGFPANHPATKTSRRFQVVTAACALFRREPWEEIGGLDTSYRNGWEDVDFCLRAGESGYEVHYCAESVVYHFESATRDLMSEVERANKDLFTLRWGDKVVPDDFGYYWVDGLFQANYGARYPIQLEVSPLLAGFSSTDYDRAADRMLYDRARQVMILLRNNIVLNVRVDEAEARAAEAERQLAAAHAQLAALTREAATLPVPETAADVGVSGSAQPPEPSPPTSPLPHRIVGTVESPGRLPDVVTDGVLIVTGWAMTETGEARVEAIINGEVRGAIEYGEPRLDAVMQYSGYPVGLNCGFTGEISVADLPDGFHTAKIRIWASDEEHAEIATTFEVDNHAFETGRVIGRLDLPVRGSMFIPRELVSVSGWTMAPSGIKSIEVLIDGERRGRVDHGALRPDIAKRRRQYPNADHCGFSGTLPMHGLGPGNHDLVVLVTAHDGQTLELANRIEVDSAHTIDGGVPVLNRHYRTWLERTAARRDAVANRPLDALNPISIHAFVILNDEAEGMLEALVDSLEAQTYDRWRLTLIPSASARGEVREAAEALARSNDRIRVETSASAEQVRTLNRAIEESDAEWLTVLRPGVILSPGAFVAIARAAANDPGARLVYTDDDRIDPGTTERWNPFFKPDWSPDLLTAMNYLGPFVAFRRKDVIDAGLLRESAADALVYDLALRVTERAGSFAHVADVLATTIAEAPAVDEPWHLSAWNEAEQQVLFDALERRGITGDVLRGHQPGLWRIEYALEGYPGVTAIIPTGGKLHLLRPCLDDLLNKTNYPNFEIMLVDNSNDDGVERLVAELSEHHDNIRRIVDTRKPFNYSALINTAIPHTSTPFLLMLNDDITVIEPDWLATMVEQAQRPEVGIVGAKLLYPDDTIQHAGVVLGPYGGAVHVFKRLPGDDPGYFDLPDVVRNCSAVTFACALIDRDVFEMIGGLDAENLPVAFNDTDFCLRTREAGFEVVYTPHATLYHHESVTKTVIAHSSEIKFLRERWGHVIEHDPFYNPNLTRTGEDARLNLEAASAT